MNAFAIIESLVALRNRFDKSNRNHADAYNTFVKGADEKWVAARAVLASSPVSGEVSPIDLYIERWERLLWDAFLDQDKVDRVMELARLNGMFDPAKAAYLSATGPALPKADKS